MHSVGRRSLTAFLISILLGFIVALTPAASTAAFALPSPPLVFACGSSSGIPSHLIVFYQLNKETSLQSYLNEVYYQPNSEHFHHFISSEQFANEYGPSKSVMAYVTNAMTDNGLNVLQSSPVLIEGSGTDTQVDSAIIQLTSAPPNVQSSILVAECVPQGFFTQNSHIPTYATDTSNVKLNLQQLQSPANVTSVNGKPIQLLVHGFQIWLPYGLQLIYDTLPLINHGTAGGGETIGIVDAFGDVNTEDATNLVYSSATCTDLTAFDAAFGLPEASCSVIYPTGPISLTSSNVGSALGWSYETALDTQYAHTMAPQAKILVAASSTAGDDLYASIEYLVNHQLANFISLSWGTYEDLILYPPPAPQLLYAYDEIFQQAAAEGIGVFASSGDTGSYDTAIPSLVPGAVPEASVQSPADDTWLTGVGGTSLNATLTRFAIFRLEYAWNYEPYFGQPPTGTGGGYSMVFSATAGQRLVRIDYQLKTVSEPDLGLTFSTIGSRGVPDIAADANVQTGVLLYQDGQLTPYVWGGTSLASPLTAGMTTTIQSASHHFTIGDLGPTMYLLYRSNPFDFYSFQGLYTFGQLNSGVEGAMFPTMFGQNGLYHVTPGRWNPVDGLGQLNAYGLSNMLNDMSEQD